MIIEHYLMLTVAAVGLFIYGQVWKRLHFAVAGCLLMLALAMASFSIDYRYCDLCQSTYTQGNFTVNTTVQDEVVEENVTYNFPSSSSIWEFIYILDNLNDGWNITGFSFAAFPCEHVCTTDSREELSLVGLWAAAAMFGFILTYERYVSRETDEGPWFSWGK